MASIAPRWNRVTPKNSDQAKVLAKYNQWDWYPIRVWPASIARSVMTRSLGDRERFAVFIFFIGNGMPPSQAVEEILEMKAWNIGQRRQITGWLNRLHTMEKYTYWSISDMRTQQVVILKEDKQASFERKSAEVPWWETADMLKFALERQDFKD